MTTSLRWTSADLEALPKNGNRYEIIDGELLVSRQPHYYHQRICGLVFSELDSRSSDRRKEVQLRLVATLYETIL